ncbi:zinc transporter ZIP9-like [Pelobates cultripes]|uniref:Zinc transporter ZIP9 n=1 Tax=Pelobates cultripes TaxID=61616 RepID=A0AAD1RHE0_PELCU|nr:zinc transporter ZIP9-like [Pelobates cultripes]
MTSLYPACSNCSYFIQCTPCKVKGATWKAGGSSPQLSRLSHRHEAQLLGGFQSQEGVFLINPAPRAPTMDGLLVVFLISLGMFLGCFLLGLIPLAVKLSEDSANHIAFLTAVPFCIAKGTALSIIARGGSRRLRDSPCVNHTEWEDQPGGGRGLPLNKRKLDKAGRCTMETLNVVIPIYILRRSLYMGFILRGSFNSFQGTYSALFRPAGNRNLRLMVSLTLSPVPDNDADGVALGAAVASSQVSVQVIVFFAVILHKAPAAFGLVTFLMHAGLEKKQIQKHLLAFSLAAPLLTITTYLILTMTGGSLQHKLSATGNGMLFSAGTFLYVATVHVLPEISGRGHSHHSSSSEYKRPGLGLLESITLVIGAVLPVLLSLGLHDG